MQIATPKAPEFPEIGVFFGILHAGSYPKNREKPKGGDFMALTRPPRTAHPSLANATAQRVPFFHAKDGADGLVRGLKTAGVPPENLRQFGSCEKMENFA